MKRLGHSAPISKVRVYLFNEETWLHDVACQFLVRHDDDHRDTLDTVIRRVHAYSVKGAQAVNDGDEAIVYRELRNIRTGDIVCLRLVQGEHAPGSETIWQKKMHGWKRIGGIVDSLHTND